MNYRKLTIGSGALGIICVAFPIAKAIDVPLGIFPIAAVVVNAADSKFPTISTGRIAIDSGTSLFTPELLDRWVALQRTLLAFPDSIRSTVPVQVVRYKDFAPDLKDDSAKFKNWGALANSNPQVSRAFTDAKIAASHYSALATQMIAARAIIQSRNLAADSAKTSGPQPSEETLKALKPIDRAIAVILPRWFEISGARRPQPPMSMRYAVEESDVVGHAAPQLLVEEWLNAENVLVSKNGSVPLNDGKLYLLGFTATWCTACKSIYAPFANLFNEYTKRGVRVMLVSPKFPSAPELKSYIEKNKIMIPVAVQGDDLMGGNAEPFEVKSLPVAILIDSKGVIRRRWLKASPDTARYRKQLGDAIEALLAEK